MLVTMTWFYSSIRNLDLSDEIEFRDFQWEFTVCEVLENAYNMHIFSRLDWFDNLNFQFQYY